MSWTEEDERQLQRLLLIEKHWEETMNPSMPALQPPAPAQTNEKNSKPPESKPTVIGPDRRHFIDRICPEGSTKPSGKMLGKLDWMG
jgi:hypothetical protein